MVCKAVSPDAQVADDAAEVSGRKYWCICYQSNESCLLAGKTGSCVALAPEPMPKFLLAREPGAIRTERSTTQCSSRSCESYPDCRPNRTLGGSGHLNLR